MGSFQLQSPTASYGQWRQRRQIQLTGRHPHPKQGSTPWVARIARWKCGPQTGRVAAATGMWTRDHRNAKPTHCLCCHSGYKSTNFTNFKFFKKFFLLSEKLEKRGYKRKFITRAHLDLEQIFFKQCIQDTS